MRSGNCVPHLDASVIYRGRNMSKAEHVLQMSIIACVQASCIASVEREIQEDETFSDILQGWRGPTVAATIELSNENWSCSGTVLTDHWIMTAAHCLEGLPTKSQMTIASADESGISNRDTNLLYEGSTLVFRHPSWHDIEFFGIKVDTGIEYDLGLIYLHDEGISSTFPNRGNLYADSRHPWYGDYRMFAWNEGFGFGSDLNGTSSCDDADPSPILRRRNEVRMDGSSDTMAISSTDVTCHRDSGGPWMFNLNDDHDGRWKMIQFGVTHGHDWGGICGGSVFSIYRNAAIVTSGLRWMETTMRSLTPVSIHNGYASGYAYVTYEEPAGCVADEGAECRESIPCCSLYDPNLCRYFNLDGTIDCYGNCRSVDGCPVWY